MNFPSIPYDEGMFGLDFQTYWNRSTEKRIEPIESDSIKQTDLQELRSLSLESWKNEAAKDTLVGPQGLGSFGQDGGQVAEDSEVVRSDIHAPKSAEMSLVRPKEALQDALWIFVVIVSIVLVVPCVLFYKTITQYWYGPQKPKYRE